MGESDVGERVLEDGGNRAVIINWRTKTEAVRWVARVAAAAAALAMVAVGPRSLAEQKAPVPAAAAACAACHDRATSSWAGTLHRRTVGAPQIPESKQACAACHRGAEAHVANVMDEGKRPTLKGMSGDAVSEICLSCHHGGKQALWTMSSHARTEEGCLTCHDPHNGTGEHMLKAPEPELCAKCHPVPVAEGNLPSHHPIPEGKMVCTDCHNVHGDQRGNLPEASNGEMCFKCHTDKQGPFQAEHPPVTEDCTICHRPHGSPVDRLLIVDQPMLCLRCHSGHSDSHRSPLVALSPNSPDTLQGISAFYSRCTSCHSRIHGTDLLSGTGNPTFMPGSPLGGAEAASAGGMASAAALDPTMWGFSEFSGGRISSSGNQNFVREYDGKNYNRLDADFSLVRYGRKDDFRMSASNIDAGADQEVSMRYGTPTTDIRFKGQGLTHRLSRFNENIDVPIAGNRVNDTDLTNGRNDFEIGRTVVELNVAARCPKLPDAKWLFNYWQQKEHGKQQFLFLDRCTSCHKIQTSEPIDRVTTITEGGVQVDLPKGSLRYLYGKQHFSNFAAEQFFNFSGRSSVFNGPAPLFGVASDETRINDVRTAYAFNDRASAAALWRTKDRQDQLGGGTLELRTGGGGMSYVLTPTLLLQGSLFRSSADVSKIEEGVSRDRDATRLDLRYTGIPHATLSVGYSKEKVDRSERLLSPESSDSNIWRSAFSYYPMSRLSLQVRYQKITTDNGAFFSDEEVPTQFPAQLPTLPNDGSLLSGVLGYQLSRATLVSGIYSRKRDNFEVDVPAPDSDRSSDNTVKTYGLQLSQTAAKSQVTAGYYHQTGSAVTNAWFGQGVYTLTPPAVAEDTNFPPIDSFAASDYTASIAMVSGEMAVSSRWRIFAHWYRTATDGQVTALDLGDYIDQNPDLNGVDVVLNPFDIVISDWWLGAGYRLDPRTEVVLSNQRRSWTDDSDPTHDGSYGVWRAGVRRSF